MDNRNWTRVRGSKVNRKYVTIDLMLILQRIRQVVDVEVDKHCPKVPVKTEYSEWVVR